MTRFPKTISWNYLNRLKWVTFWTAGILKCFQFSFFFFFLQILSFKNTLRNEVSIQLTCFAYLWLKGHIVFPSFLTLLLSLLQLHSFCCSWKFKLCPGCCECFFLKTPVLFFSPPIRPPSVHLCPSLFSFLLFSVSFQDKVDNPVVKCVTISNIFFLSFCLSLLLSFCLSPLLSFFLSFFH